jgi:predicted 2-oxoglutarate/Fe(II)-dependent dioxygenase YbiX
MSSITTTFADALGTVSRPGTFFVTGSEQMLAPGLEVEGVGPIGLPLPAVQAKQLIAVANRAPFGRGEATVTDIAVRRTWQIAADRVRIRGKHWPTTLQAIVARVAEGLGLTDPIEAELYKMLVYDEGSFFVPHRDTEKSPGMFATLVLVLPSVSEGGALIVRHKDHEARLELRCEEPSEVAFGAFYADCVHEVLPVTAGHRLVLVYNLVRRGAGRLPGVPDYGGEVAMIAERLERWADSLRAGDEGEPQKLIYPLEHAYTPAELDFGALKGADAGVGQVVVAAAVLAGCSAHLALVSIDESGSAVQTGGSYRSRRGRYDDDEDDDGADEFEIDEVIDHNAKASHWRRTDGRPSPLTDLPVEEAEFAPPLTFEDLEPDEEHFHEATGNEGASYERTYRRAALILWPEEQILGVINQGGRAVTLPFLEDLATRWAEGGDPALRAQAAELSGLVMAGWSMGEWYPGRDSDRTDAGRFLNLLVRLNDPARLEQFLTALAGRRGFDIGDSADIADALRTLPAVQATGLAQRLIEGAAKTALGACGALLAGIAKGTPAAARPAAQILVSSLPGKPAPADPALSWRRGPGVRSAFIVDLFTALGAIDATLATVAADHVLKWPATYDFDTVLVAASLTLLETSETAGQAPVQRLRAASIGHLNQRIALDLEPPGDWRRDDTVGCGCEDCRALARFLGDASQKTWVFAAAQPRRSHLEDTIRKRRCDVDFSTEKRGSPHRLVCTKNQASYRRRCAQRVDDLQLRAKLAA